MGDIMENTASKMEDKRKADGTFAAGSVHNPGGRPKMSAEDREAWQALSTKCRTKLDALADKEDLPPATLVKIAELATDRGYGKAVQSVGLENPSGELFRAFSDLADSDLFKLAQVEKPKL
jgi:hypothetical protein